MILGRKISFPLQPNTQRASCGNLISINPYHSVRILWLNYHSERAHFYQFLYSAPMDSSTFVPEPSPQTSNIYEITKHYFLSLAKKFEKGFPIPVSIHESNAIITVMPTGPTLAIERNYIKNSLQNLHGYLKKQGEWELAGVRDKDTYLYVLYLPGEFSLEDATDTSNMTQLSYSEAELEDAEK